VSRGVSGSSTCSGGNATGTSPLQTTGLVLAGGRSSRFGSNKLAVRIEGVSILGRAIATLASVTDDVVVVIDPSGPVPDLPTDPPHRLVRDAHPFEGPLAGVASGLGAIGTEISVVMAGDMPFVHVEVLREMVRVCAEPSVDAVVLMDGDRARPVPCVLRTRPALDAAQSLLASGEHRLRALPSALHATAIDEAVWTRLDPTRRTLVDVDEPGDLTT
jgi:molybdenum cofactor guanylyltransferase